MTWFISPDCRAERHHTLRAGQGRGIPIPCVCPRALEMLERTRVSRLNAKNANKGAIKTGHHALVENTAIARPDLSTGTCRTSLYAMQAFDDFTDRQGSGVLRDKVRALCHGCPVLQECKRWILRTEQPPGGWQGMIGGLTPPERRAFAIRQPASAA